MNNKFSSSKSSGLLNHIPINFIHLQLAKQPQSYPQYFSKLSNTQANQTCVFLTHFHTISAYTSKEKPFPLDIYSPLISQLHILTSLKLSSPKSTSLRLRFQQSKSTSKSEFERNHQNFNF